MKHQALFILATILLISFKGENKKVVLGSHDEMGNVVCFSPFGKWLASGSNDNKIKIWSVGKQKLQTEWVAHSVGVKDLVFTPNGDYLISAGLDKLIKIWDTKTWKLHKTLTGHDLQVLALAVSPNGQTLYSGGDDKKIQIWNTNNFDKIGELEGHFDRVLSLNVSKNGKYLVSTGGDRMTKSPGNLKIWNLETNKLAYNFEESSYAIQDASLSEKGTMVFYAGNFQEAILLKWQENKVAAKKKLTDYGINSVVLDGLQTYVCTSFSGKVISWKIGGDAATLDEHNKDANSISLSADKTWISSTGVDGKVKMFKLN